MARNAKATWIKRGLLALLLLGLVGASVHALRPQPVPVDLATVARETIEVTVDEEGKTRIRDVFEVSAPVGGRLMRVDLEVGDVVSGGESVVARIRPVDPAPLDIRTRRELEAAVSAARAAVALARAEVARARSELAFAVGDFARAEELALRGNISQKALDRARVEKETQEAALDMAEANLELSRRELESAEARLIGPEDPGVLGARGECCVLIRAPVDGRVLTLLKESEQVVRAGEPILEIGDPTNLEIVVELLSSDAVRIEEGALARIDNWGGEGVLEAVVDRVSPAGFTKVSALGIEEQRVETILRLAAPPETRARLGHDFRVFARILVLRREDALAVPLGALFRRGADWAVYRLVGGRARETLVEIGPRNREVAAVTSGLEAGDRVVLHPTDRVADAVPIVERGAPDRLGAP